MDDIRQLAEQHISKLSEQRSILNYRISELNESIETYLKFQEEIFHTVKVMKMTSAVLQDLIDTVSLKNLRRIESLVNAALASIFWDMTLEIKIEQDVKRNVNVYNIVVLKNGHRGTIKSNGGGIWSVIAAITKILCNVLLHKFPFVMFDESLSMVADKYVPATIKFVKDLSKDLEIIIGAITHKRSFIENSPLVYSIDFAPEEERALMGPEILKMAGEEPFIKVERLER